MARPALFALAGLAFAATSATARAQVTLNINNNFTEALGGTYFGGHIESEDVYIYFTGIGASDVSYNGGTFASEGSGIQLSSVLNGSFSLSGNINAARAYAILGSNAPSTIPLPSGPDPVSVTYPYAFIEFTTLSGGQADQSFLNQVAFPTSLSNGSQTNAWSPTTTAQSVATAFNTAFPTAPYAPASGVVPDSGTPYDPYSATTVTRSAGSDLSTINGHRVVAASNVNLPAAAPPPPTPQLGTGYTNVPGFNNYLTWLKDNQPTEGWKIAYNAPGFDNSTYVGYLKVTGSNNAYGLELSNFTYGGTFSSGTITGGTTVSGTITYAANDSTQSVFGADYTGNWTDMTIFGATDPTGSAVTFSGSLGALDTASVLYTVSAAMGPGILGSDAYVMSGSNTDFFFKAGFTPLNALSDFFANSEFGELTQDGFYDKYWYTMLEAGGLDGGTYAGYFTPYDDHFSNLDVLMSSDSGTLTWDLGTTAVPEPSTVGLLSISGAAFCILLWKRSRRKSMA